MVVSCKENTCKLKLSQSTFCEKDAYRIGVFTIFFSISDKQTMPSMYCFHVSSISIGFYMQALWGFSTAAVFSK